MIKRIISAALALLMLSISALLSGCSLFGIEDGFRAYGDPIDPHYCAYKSDKKVFDIDDVTLEFYYGYSKSLDKNQKKESYPTFELRFNDEENNTYLVRTVEENFISDKFYADYDIILLWWTSDIKYNHSEKITIPKEIFSKESGWIYFGGYGINEIIPEGYPEEYPEDYPIGEERCLFSIPIYYMRVGDKVELSDREFDK